MKRSNRGFTLVELIIVIAVIGVLAAILIPTFANVIDKSNAKSAYSDARNIVTDLIADYTEETTKFPDFLIFSVKGKKLYAFGYKSEMGQVIEYKDNPIKSYDPDKTLDEQTTDIINELKTKGALELVDETTLHEFFRFDGTNGLHQAIIRNSFDPAVLSVRADIIIQELVFFGADQVQSQTPAGPDEPDGPGEAEPEPITIDPEFDSETGVFTYRITENKAIANVILNMKPFVDMLKSSLVFDQYAPGSLDGYAITIIDETGHKYEISEASFKSDMVTALHEHKGLELGISPEAKPAITKSTKFLEYIDKLKELGVCQGSTIEENAQEYVNAYSFGMLDYTYTQFLKEIYGELDHDHITYVEMASNEILFNMDMDMTACYDEAVGNGLLAGGHPIEDSEGNVMRHVEPEIIDLMLDFLYDQSFTMSFLESMDEANKYASRLGNPYSNFYKIDYNTVTNWKTHYTNMNFYSLYDLVVSKLYPKNNLNFTVTDEEDGTRTMSGVIMVSWHGFLGGDAYQCTIIEGIPDFTITLEPTQG